MTPRIGLNIGGPVVAEVGVRLGRPTWGPRSLLRDLELRLGLSPADDSAAARVPSWVARIKSIADSSAFYARSFAADELGTATALLQWRDALVDAGWSGAAIPNGGSKLAALAAIELQRHPAETPLGRADRLVRVERALARTPARIYESLDLLEAPELWPRRWQDLFARLEDGGTSLGRVALDLPGAPAASDLGLLQAKLRGDRREDAIRGDGTLLFLEADTPADLAELTAALLARGIASGNARRDSSCGDVIVRCVDAPPLEAALARHGLAPQGCTSESAWRPAMQVLPLAIELAFAPRDPYRVLDLLTLALGPLRGAVGARLARAVTRQPGVGGKEWARQKAEAAHRLHDRHARLAREQGLSEADADDRASKFVAEHMKLVEVWLEGPLADPAGASRAELLAVTTRVRSWLQLRLRSGEVDVHGAAHAQCIAFEEALARDTRDVFSQEEARQLADHFARTEQAFAATIEAAGRLAHVNHPSALLTSCDRVWLWNFVSSIERRPPRSPWNDDERAALAAAGITFADPSAALRAEADSWRRAVLAAQGRVVFAVPRTLKGIATAPHSLWDEIRARLALDERRRASLVRDVRRVLDGAPSSALVALGSCTPLHLPPPRGEWLVPSDALRGPVQEGTTSVTSLEKIASCPLAWVLEHRAHLRSGAMSRIASGPMLNGNLGHRLVEELHLEGAFALPEDALCELASTRFESLLCTEGATLLVPGASVERLQLTRQVLRSVRALYRYLEGSGRRIAAVEEVVTTTSAVGPLHGRLDLRLVDDEGRPAILDLKWGASTYRKLLSEGRAVQLAVYARAVAESEGLPSLPPAGYFALASGKLLSTDPRMADGGGTAGPSLETTLTRVQATARAVLAHHERGRIPVLGTKHASPLLEVVGVPASRRQDHLEADPRAACSYCDYDALCGKKWEPFA